MAISTRTIKRRIKSIGNTRKITKAMELVAAAKMRKAVKAALATRPYACLAWEMISLLSEMKDLALHPLLKVKPVKKLLLVVLSSNLFKKIAEQIKNPSNLAIQRSFGQKIPPKSEAGMEIEAVTVGRKSERMMRRLAVKIIAAFSHLSDTPRLPEASPIAQLIQEEYVNGHYEKVVIVYTDFLSAINQKPKLRQLLPLSMVDLEKMLLGEDLSFRTNVDFIFEPEPRSVLENMLPRLVEIQIYQALLESSASEHSARMLAMRNATDAANEIIDDLTFTFNQTRQAAITREISEISAGKAALE